MTHDIRQWLAEIQGLQQKLAEVQQERDQAYISAANWRNLYEVEAKQRRTEVETSEATIAALKAELSAYQHPNPDAADHSAILRQQVEQWQTPDELKLHLMQALLERDRLLQALESEQQAHAQTRADLTTALGDTMDLLAKARSSVREMRC
jgi:predicted RNase H-like nuclease (RuvC/YqgF family)